MNLIFYVHNKHYKWAHLIEEDSEEGGKDKGGGDKGLMEESRIEGGGEIEGVRKGKKRK